MLSTEFLSEPKLVHRILSPQRIAMSAKQHATDVIHITPRDCPLHFGCLQNKMVTFFCFLGYAFDKPFVNGDVLICILQHDQMLPPMHS